MASQSVRFNRFRPVTVQKFPKERGSEQDSKDAKFWGSLKVGLLMFVIKSLYQMAFYIF